MKAERVVEKVTKLAPVTEEKTTGVTLHLSKEEAAALFVLTSQVNSTNQFVGSICDGIYFQLSYLGFKLNYDYQPIDSKRHFGNAVVSDVKIPE